MYVCMLVHVRGVYFFLQPGYGIHPPFFFFIP